MFAGHGDLFIISNALDPHCHHQPSNWDPTQGYQVQGQYYWGSKPVGYYEASVTHFQHQDWLGTERARTTYNGSVEGTFTSLPFGDGLTVATGTDTDAYHFGMLDHDYATDTEHAQFRQYNNYQGRWLRPDPYYGSYDFSNPQSFNRYAYVLNNPLSVVDPSGLVLCDYGSSDYGGEDYDDADTDQECTDNGGTVAGVYATVSVDGGGGNSDIDVFSGVNSTILIDYTVNAPNNGRNCSAGSASAGQYAAASAQVAAMTAQFFSGLGPTNQTFGPGSATSQVMGQSAGVQSVLNSYYMTGQTSGLYTFRVADIAMAGANPVAQFVGSFRWSISGGTLSLTNTTSFRSLFFDMGGQWQRFPLVTPYGTFTSPMGNTHQTYQIGVTCH
jgi:RHS repeat-associated protein